MNDDERDDSGLREAMLEVIARLRTKDDYAYGDSGDAQEDGKRLAGLAVRIIERQDAEIARLRCRKGPAITIGVVRLQDSAPRPLSICECGGRIERAGADPQLGICLDCCRQYALAAPGEGE